MLFWHFFSCFFSFLSPKWRLTKAASAMLERRQCDSREKKIVYIYATQESTRNHTHKNCNALRKSERKRQVAQEKWTTEEEKKKLKANRRRKKKLENKCVIKIITIIIIFAMKIRFILKYTQCILWTVSIHRRKVSMWIRVENVWNNI